MRRASSSFATMWHEKNNFNIDTYRRDLFYGGKQKNDH